MPLEIFDESAGRLERALDIAARRQAVISHNVANANTRGYKPLRFDEVLGRAVEKAGGRGIILEEEMADLASNSLAYSSYVKLLASKINIMRAVATQGRR